MWEDTPRKADVIVYDREAAKIEAKNLRPGLTLWTESFRQGNGACECSVIWGKGPHDWCATSDTVHPVQS